MKHILAIAAALLVIVVALNLFNNGNVGGAFLLVIAAVAPPATLYFAYRKAQNDLKSHAFDNAEVEQLNKVHNKSQDLILTLEEMNYIFHRDFQQTLHETREFNTKLFEQASAQISSL